MVGKTQKVSVKMQGTSAPRDSASFLDTAAKLPIHNDDASNIATIDEDIIDPYGDRGHYKGKALRTSQNSDDNDDNDESDNPADDLVPHGSGTMEYADGRTYRGEWNRGHWHGRGRASYPNGDSYEGTYREDQRHGRGVYKWSDGRRFEGSFANDQRNGHGLYQWPDGSRYEGGFEEGLRHGTGIYTVSAQNVAISCDIACLVLLLFTLGK